MVKRKQLIRDTVIVKKRTGDAYVAWFEPSRSFVLFEKPTYKVFSLYCKGLDINEIVKAVTDNYRIKRSESRMFVKDIIHRTEAYCSMDNAPYKPPELITDIINITSDPFSINHYRIGNKSITFHFGNEHLMNCFHSLFVHLEENDPSECDDFLEVFEYSGLLIFRCNGVIVEAFRIEHINYLKGCVFQKLYGILYGYKVEDWMITLHASGISDGKSAIIFPAEAGGGKSTLAALLKAHDYMVLSDDFITIDRKEGFSFRFPAAVSIKEGSVNILSQYFPELEALPTVKSSAGKSVRYLPLKNNLEKTNNAFPVKAFVFVNYSPGQRLSLVKAGKKEALQSLLAETWVNPDPENVRQFFDWIDNINFYHLGYSEPSDAVRAISKIFNQ